MLQAYSGRLAPRSRHIKYQKIERYTPPVTEVPDSLTFLPDEVLQIILEILHRHDNPMTPIMAVCTSIRDPIIKSPRLWRRILVSIDLMPVSLRVGSTMSCHGKEILLLGVDKPFLTLIEAAKDISFTTETPNASRRRTRRNHRKHASHPTSPKLRYGIDASLLGGNMGREFDYLESLMIASAVPLSMPLEHSINEPNYPSPLLVPRKTKQKTQQKQHFSVPLAQHFEAYDPLLHVPVASLAKTTRSDANIYWTVPNIASTSSTDPWEPQLSAAEFPISCSEYGGDTCPDLTGEVRRLSSAPVYSGPYSRVYTGIWEHQKVAIKEIRPLCTDSLRAIRRRTRREVQNTSRFNHPNILPIYGVMEPTWCHYGCIITPWCTNGDSSGYIRRKNVGSSERYRMLCGVAAGVEYLHALSVVHGDIKPGNILINDLGTPLICDFGLVRSLDGTTTEYKYDNTTTVHVGTVRYLAYELVKPDPPEPRSMASDIHAVGCVAYEFMYLERPYATRFSNAAGHIFRDIADGVPPAYRPDPPLHPAIGTFWDRLESCWDKDPARRPNISAVRTSLKELGEEVF